MIQKKVCLLGVFAVGKTSLIRRYVQSVFDEKYLSTIGVKVDKKSLTVFDREMQLLIWDIQGKEVDQTVPESYLRGMAGGLIVLDGTRKETLSSLQALKLQVRAVVGEVPFVVLINKLDLYARWEISENDIAQLIDKQFSVLRTSAKTGEQVEEAFERLAQKMITS
jgi:small GTP-binding protein